MDDVARNIEAVQRLEQAYNQRDYDTVRGTLASDFVAHTPGSETLPNGVAGAIGSNEGSFQSFSDEQTEILEIFGEGDRVVSHVRMWGDERRRHAVRRSPRPAGRSTWTGSRSRGSARRQDPRDLGADGRDRVGNKVAVRSTMTGTDTNGMMQGMPATGKPFSMGAIDVFTFDGAGMNTEHYGVYDIMGTMGQLGLLPPPPPNS